MRLVHMQPLPEGLGAIGEYCLEDERNLRLMRYGDLYAVGVESLEETVQAVLRNHVVKGFAAEHDMEIVTNRPAGAQRLESTHKISWPTHITSVDFVAPGLLMRWRKGDRLYPKATLTLASRNHLVLPEAMGKLDQLADPMTISQALGALAIKQS